MFDKNIYIDRRKKLMTTLDGGKILMLGNQNSPMNFTHNAYPFVQDSSFLYYIGVDLPNCACLLNIDTDETTFYMNEKTVHDIVWIGKTKPVKHWGERCGADNIKPLNDLKKDINSKDKIHFLPQYRVENKFFLKNLLGIKVGKMKNEFSIPLINQVIAQRSIKSEEEIDEICSALEVTNKIHQHAMKVSKPNRFEYEIVAEMEEIIKKHELSLAYPIIFSKDGQILHNSVYHNKIKDGDLLLNDSGANSKLKYASDITRTFPANGKFTTQQREIYSIVQKMQEKVIERLAPGVSFKEMHFLSAKIGLEGLKKLGLIKGNVDDAMKEGAHGLFYPHGLGHMLGLDVHDMEALGEDFVGYNKKIKREVEFGIKFLRLGKELQKGFCITVEPGIYFIPELFNQWKEKKKLDQFINYTKFESYMNFGGIRIEDNVMITDGGYKNLSEHIPKSINDIENIMK